MRVSFTIEEMVLNQLLAGKEIYDEDEKKIIQYIKSVPMSYDVQVHFTNGDVQIMSTLETYDWEVAEKKNWKDTTKGRLKKSIANK